MLTQVTCCANTPPRIGPSRVPIAFLPLRTPNHSPLNLSGIVSETIVSVMTAIPSPPASYTLRKTRTILKFFARAQHRHSARKNSTEEVRTSLRPKMLREQSMTGWNTT
jgi:hypothetical protein